MAPSAWLKRLCSAPGKTRKVKPSWWMKRRRWKGRLAIGAASSGSARMKPWTGSRIESTRRVGSAGLDAARSSGSVQPAVGGEVAERLEPREHLLAAAQDRQHGEAAVGQRLLQQQLLAQCRHVEVGGDAVDQLLEEGA